MAKCYDFNSGRLKISYDNIIFDLELRNPVTQVFGNSATGKTLLTDLIKRLQTYSSRNGSDLDDMDVSNILVIDNENDLYKIISTSNNLIIMDEFDLIIKDNRNIIEYIVQDRKNHYLLFARRGYPLSLSPNYYGELINEDGIVKIFFKYSVEGWF